MLADIWVQDALEALERAGENTEPIREQIEGRLSSPPRLALVGEFNSGKSSLIKRLCVEEGIATPKGLVIKGEPSTTGVDEVQVGNWLLVDTPGLDSENAEHGEIARAASLEADRTLLLVLPSLWAAGSETEALVQELEPGRLDFVLSRADEPHMSPNAETVAAWGHAKEAALRSKLDRYGHGGAQVFIVAADPRGRVANRVADRARFDSTREWDGVDRILAILHEDCPAELRARATRRLVRSRAAAVLADRRTRLEEATDELRAAEAAVKEQADRIAAVRKMAGEERQSLRDALVVAAREGTPQAAIPRVVVASDDWLSAFSRRFEARTEGWGISVEPWKLDLAEAVRDPGVDLDSDSDGGGEPGPQFDYMSDRLKAKLKDLRSQSDADLGKHRRILNDYERHKERNTVRKLYESDKGPSDLREVRSSRRRVQDERRKQAGMIALAEALNWIDEERKAGAEEKASIEAREAQRAKAEAKAVIIAGRLFEGIPDRDDVGGVGDVFREAEEQLDEQLGQYQDDAGSARARVAELEDLIGRLEAVLKV